MRAVTLIGAILDGDLAAVDAAIAAGVDVNALPASGHETALHVAIEHQRVEVVRRLIAAGAFVNDELATANKDDHGWSPLVHAIDIESDAAWQAHHEIGHESTDLTELLLISGAVPTRRAFEVASEYDNRKALGLLRKYAKHLCQ